MKPGKRIKRRMIFLIGTIVLTAGLLWSCLFQGKREPEKIFQQFSISGGRPITLTEGKLYEYSVNGEWIPLLFGAEAVQIVRGEKLCVLQADGIICYAQDSSAEEENLPLMSGYRLYMVNEVLNINKAEPFICMNHSLEYPDFRALLQNGDILYQGMDSCERYHLEEEVPAFLSGSYILTEEGNVYHLDIDTDGNSGNMITELKCIYEGGNVVKIDASETSDRCLALLEDGTVISWSDSNPLDISRWKEIVEIEQGFNFAVGLTEDGRVLFAGCDTSSSEAAEKVLSTWKDMIQIAVYYDTIAGLTKNGECVFFNLTE